MNKELVKNIMQYYKELTNTEGYEWVNWTKKRRPFTSKKANQFFVGVLLDQQQPAERAWEAGEHLVENHFNNHSNWWEGVNKTHHSTVKSICKTGFDGNSYALRYTTNKFPEWLRSAAKVIINEYDGDVRNVWKIKSADEIYDNFSEFDGIGDALAKMGQFILVRNYGVAGGIENRSHVSVKPDEQIRRVAYRSGIASSAKLSDVVESIEKLNLKSPADFDAAVWTIGRNYCKPKKPDCNSCPIEKTCLKNGV